MVFLSADEEQTLVIPWDSLEPETLISLVEEFVTREGTEYGEFDVGLQHKVNRVVAGLREGEYLIVYDRDSQTCNIVTTQQLAARPGACAP